MEKSFSERVAEASEAVPAVSAQQASAILEKDPSVVFIDPRDAEDIIATTGMIPGAINIPLNLLTENSDKALPEELGLRTRRIIAACQGGPMGALAAHALKLRGYENVAFIDGGTQGWLDAGYVTEK